HFGLDLQTNRVACDPRREVEPDAVFLPLNGHRVGEPLDHRDWNLAACQEACVLSVVCNQIWLGETLKQSLVLQSANRGTNIVFLAEKKEVQQIAERQLAF